MQLPKADRESWTRAIFMWVGSWALRRASSEAVVLNGTRRPLSLPASMLPIRFVPAIEVWIMGIWVWSWASIML